VLQTLEVLPAPPPQTSIFDDEEKSKVEIHDYIKCLKLSTVVLMEVF
jgi:hypothetical protein